MGGMLTELEYAGGQGTVSERQCSGRDQGRGGTSVQAEGTSAPGGKEGEGLERGDRQGADGAAGSQPAPSAPRGTVLTAL